jgi:hypothetical protein
MKDIAELFLQGCKESEEESSLMSLRSESASQENFIGKKVMVPKISVPPILSASKMQISKLEMFKISK